MWSFESSLSDLNFMVFVNGKLSTQAQPHARLVCHMHMSVKATAGDLLLFLILYFFLTTFLLTIFYSQSIQIECPSL